MAVHQEQGFFDDRTSCYSLEADWSKFTINRDLTEHGGHKPQRLVVSQYNYLVTSKAQKPSRPHVLIPKRRHVHKVK